LLHYRRRIRLFCPDWIPPDLVLDLQRAFEDRPDIYSIHVLLACHPDDVVSHWLFLIDFAGERASVFPSVIKTVGEYMKPGETYEVMQADKYLLKSALKCTIPIYLKLRLQS
jgi:hypothetical protein